MIAAEVVGEVSETVQAEESMLDSNGGEFSSLGNSSTIMDEISLHNGKDKNA